MQNGRVGFLKFSELAPYLTDQCLHVLKQTVKSATEGGTREMHEEYLYEPASMDGARKQWIQDQCSDANRRESTPTPSSGVTP